MEELSGGFRGIPDRLDGALQENVVTLAANSDQHCKLVALNVPLHLYSNETLREIATGVYEYVQSYGRAPRDHLPDLFERRLEKNDARATLLYEGLQNIHALSLNGFNEEYVVNQLTRFVRQQYLRTCVMKLIKAADDGDVEGADKSIDEFRKTSYAQFSPGIRLAEYVQTLGNDDRARSIVNLGIPLLDKHELGPARKELHTMLAPPKRGKTWWLLHVAKRAAMARLPVLYITLEVSAEILASRLLQSFFGMTRKEAASVRLPEVVRSNRGEVTALNMEEVANRLALTSKKGIAKVRRAFGAGATQPGHIGRIAQNILIQAFPTKSLKLSGLEAFLANLDAYNHFMPAVVIIDYADLMHVPTQNYRLGLSELFAQLRGLAVEHNFALCTASQSNRGSVGKRLITERDVAEDFSKIAISDVVLSYNQIASEREAQTARLFVAAARNSKDRFSVTVTQAYEIGQFCIDSFVVDPRTYFDEMLPRGKGNPDDREDAEGEDL